MKCVSLLLTLFGRCWRERRLSTGGRASTCQLSTLTLSSSLWRRNTKPQCQRRMSWVLPSILRYSSFACYTLIVHPSDAPWYTCQTPVIHLSYTRHTLVIHPSDTYYTPAKRLSYTRHCRQTPVMHLPYSNTRNPWDRSLLILSFYHSIGYVIWHVASCYFPMFSVHIMDLASLS